MGTITAEHDNIIDDIHISLDPKKIVSVPKDEVEKIVKNILPDEIKNLPEHVMHEAVNKVVIPVISDVLKPLEKLVFSVGVKVLETAYGEAQKVVGEHASGKVVSDELINEAISYGKGLPDAGMNDWYRWLNAMGHPDYVFAWPALTVEEGREQEKIWDKWKPFVDALEEGQYYRSTHAKKIIEDFNKINFYIANTGNVSVGLYFRNMWDRAQSVIDILKKYEHSGIPIKRSAIMSFVKVLGPDALDITVSAKIELGITIGGSIGAWGVPADLFDILLNEILKEAGVPA